MTKKRLPVMTDSKMTSMTRAEMHATAKSQGSKTDIAKVRVNVPYIWDGKDEDERPLTREEMQVGVEAYRRQRGRPAGGEKESTTIRFDRDILAAFRAGGPGWQTRMNAVLRDWLKKLRLCDGRLCTIGPVTRAPSMMCNCDDSNFLGGNLIDDAIRKSTKKRTTLRTAKDCSKLGVVQNEICRSLKFGNECMSELNVCLGSIESRCIMQFSKCRRKNDEFHFNVARTWARASAIGMV